MNPDPDYSAAYVVLSTDHPASLEGHGLAFTIGRGNELCVHAIELLRELVVGETVENIQSSWVDFWRRLTGEGQLRWLGPEKGVIHLATAAVVNAIWDLEAKIANKPLWRYLSDMPVEQLVDVIDFRYLSDVLSREEALSMLALERASRADRIQWIVENSYPAYTTSVGWLGYSDEKIRGLCREALGQGWTRFKMKVGRSLEDDCRRARIIRGEIGWDCELMMDANQIWDVGEAIDAMKTLAEYRPLWIEEPTSPDDILGHRRIAEAIAPIGVASGEHCHNRVMFKQLLQASALAFCQIDSCRLGGVNEVLAVILMAKKFGVPVCPHAGGVGLCEHVQHLSIFDFVCVSGETDGRMTEYVDHLHEHFVDPVRVRRGAYLAPEAPGYSTAMKLQTREKYRYPDGEIWRELLA